MTNYQKEKLLAGVSTLRESLDNLTRAILSASENPLDASDYTALARDIAMSKNIAKRARENLAAWQSQVDAARKEAK